jgi:hypothetical protein
MVDECGVKALRSGYCAEGCVSEAVLTGEGLTYFSSTPNPVLMSHCESGVVDQLSPISGFR